MIKVLLPITIFFLFCNASYSQKLKYDAIKKKIFFEEVFNINDSQKDQIADQVWLWINENISDSSLKYQDDQTGEFVIKTSNNFLNPIGPDYKVKVWYEMSIFTEDNSVSYKISKLIFENMVLQDGNWESHKIPAEKMLVGVGYYQPNGRPKRLSELYNNETQRIIYQVSSNLKQFLHSHLPDSELADIRNN